MKPIEILSMAIHNLWSRKLRTTLNLLGVVLGCVVLCMTFAGTRGVSQGLQAIVDSSEDVRTFTIRSAHRKDAKVPEEVLVIEGEMSEARQERIRKQIRENWLAKNVKQRRLDVADLDQIRALDHVRDVVPQSILQCRMLLDGAVEQGLTHGISPQSNRNRSRIIAGGPLGDDDEYGILISEFAAYQLGFKSDADLRQLVGKELEVKYRLRGQRMSQFLRLINAGLGDGDLVDQVEIYAAIKRLVENIDSTNLSEHDKGLIQSAFRLSAVPKTEELATTERFAVRGVVRGDSDDDIFSFLRTFHAQSESDIYLHHKTATRIDRSREDYHGFWSVLVAVDNVANLRTTVEEIKALGFRVTSAIRIVERIDEEIQNAKLAVSALALLILVISAIGISNTMIISVLERTPEFGIMKALGARDSQVLKLMLFEGAMTGVVGAFVAICISLGLSWGIARLVQQYVSDKIRQDYNGQIFSFSMLDISIVFIAASIICTLASIAPAYRAARLDPIVAMRGN